MTDYAAAPKKSNGCLKALGCGCLAVVVLLIVLGVGGFFGLRHLVRKFTAEYTATEPRALPAVAMSDEQVQALMTRVKTFGEAVQAGQAVEPLVLRGDDLNALIRASAAKELADSIYVTIADSQIRAEVSLSLDRFGKWTRGRYLNGRAAVTVSLRDGRLQAFCEGLEVNGKSLPDAAMSQLRQENLAKDASSDPKTAEVIARLESIEVRGDTLIVVPRRASAQAP
jgi:hypothetical protein